MSNEQSGQKNYPHTRYRYAISDELYDALYDDALYEKQREKHINIYPPRHIASLSCCCKERDWWAQYWSSDLRHSSSGLALIKICPKCFTVWIYTGAGNLIVRANENTPKEALDQYDTYDNAHNRCEVIHELADSAYAILVDIFKQARAKTESEK